MPHEEFKVMVIKLLNGLQGIVAEISESFNKEIENIKNSQC